MAAILKDGTYESVISSGSHGDKFQKELALTMFLRMRESSSSFRLAYEVKKADKFDDIVLIDDENKEIHFIQVKHGDVKEGKVKYIDVEALFPTAAKGKCKCSGDFVLCKYVKSFLTVMEGFDAEKEGKQYAKKFYIFSNKDLRTNEKNDPKHKEWLEAVGEQQVNTIVRFPGSRARHLKLTPTEKAIKQLSECVNKDIIKVKVAIKELFNSANVSQILIDYCTPLKQVLNITRGNKSCYTVSFNLESIKHTNLYDLLVNDKFDMKKQVEVRENFLQNNSRLKDFPPYVSEDKIRDFFREYFILSVNQPNDLRPAIDYELRTWMKTWVRPDLLGRLCKKDFEHMYTDLEERLEELNKTYGNNTKNVLKRNNIEKCLMEIKNYNKTLKTLKAEQLQHYINRTIVYIENMDESTDTVNAADLEGTLYNKISDIRLVKELRGKFKDLQHIVLVADPGMGKTSLLQFVAFEKQKLNDADVFLVYFSDLAKELEKEENISDLDDVLNILKAALSEENCEVIRSAPDQRDDKGHRIVLLMDGFDEIHTQYTHKISDMLDQLESKKSVQIVISSRMHIENKLKNSFKVRSMQLEPFSKEDQISYLRKMWHVQEEASNSNRLLDQFHSSIPLKLCEICGLPLMMRMLAEIYTDQFKIIHEEVKAGKSQLIDFSVDKINAAELYEKFVRKCFHMKLKEKYDYSGDLTDPEFDSVIEGFILEHQLLAMTLLDSTKFKLVLNTPYYEEKYDQFRKRCEKGSEKSLLVKVVNENVQICHLSYAEYFVAKYVCDNINLLGVDRVISIFSEHEIVRRLSMVKMEGNDKFYKILNEFCTRNWKTALWACESGCLSMVSYLVQNFKSFSPDNLDEMLHMSANHGYKEICEFLIMNESDPNKMNKKKWTPLHSAAESGHAKVIKVLIINGADPNLITIDGETPLHITAQNGHKEAADVLINNNVDVNAMNNKNCTALHLAAENGRDQVVDLLLLNKANVDAQTKVKWTALHFAVQNGHDPVINVLITKGADIDSRTINGETPLYIALQNGHEKAAKVLINNNADVTAIDGKQNPALYVAAENDHDRLVDLLLMAQPRVDTQEKQLQVALNLAARNGQDKVIKLLLNKIANAKLRTIIGSQLLRIAAKEGFKNVVSSLIVSNVDVNAVDEAQLTALHFAAQNGNDQMVDLLLQNEAYVDAQDEFKWTALHYAAQSGNDQVIKLLITKGGADTNSRTIDGETPLHIAVKNGNKKAAKVLIINNADVTSVDGKQRSALYVAAENVHDRLVELLLMDQHCVASKEMQLQVALNLAAKNQQFQVIKVLLDKIENINLWNIITNNLLQTAVKENSKNAVSFLIVNNVDVNAVDEVQLTALHLAAQNGNDQMVELLLQNGAYVDAQDGSKWTALHYAAEGGHDQVIKLLITQGANINSQTIIGRTPLHIAALNGNLKIVTILIGHNVDVNTTDGTQLTALHMAVQNGHDQVARLLLKNEAELNAEDKNKWSVLHFAAQNGHPDMINILIAKGANINSRTIDGETPLHIATQNGHKKTADDLIYNNADVTAVDRNGRSALHMAAENGHDQLVDLLESMSL